MRISDFDLYYELLRERSGLRLEPSDSFKLDSRLKPVARKWGYTSLSALSMNLRGVPDEEIIDDILDAMTSHETSFFRDGVPFSYINDDILPFLRKNNKKSKRIRVWSAGCASGQEAYSLALLLREFWENNRGWSTEILATDLSNSALNKARKGRYSRFEVQQGLPLEMLLENFDQIDRDWRIKDPIRDSVTFARINLMGNFSSYPALRDPFDIIICRNVLSSFAPDARREVLDKLSKQMTRKGILILGKGENIENMNDIFTPVGHDTCAYLRAGEKYKGLNTTPST